MGSTTLCLQQARWPGRPWLGNTRCAGVVNESPDPPLNHPKARQSWGRPWESLWEGLEEPWESSGRLYIDKPPTCGGVQSTATYKKPEIEQSCVKIGMWFTTTNVPSSKVLQNHNASTSNAPYKIKEYEVLFRRMKDHGLNNTMPTAGTLAWEALAWKHKVRRRGKREP